MTAYSKQRGMQVRLLVCAPDFLPAPARKEVAHGQAACLVLDVHMNEMSGFELQERLAVPVIFITSHDDAVTRTRIEKSGANGHLWKPFDEHAVLSAIRRAVGLDHESSGTP